MGGGGKFSWGGAIMGKTQEISLLSKLLQPVSPYQTYLGRLQRSQSSNKRRSLEIILRPG